MCRGVNEDNPNPSETTAQRFFRSCRARQIRRGEKPCRAIVSECSPVKSGRSTVAQSDGVNENRYCICHATLGNLASTGHHAELHYGRYVASDPVKWRASARKAR